MKDPPTCYRASKKLPLFNIDPLDDVAIDIELKDNDSSSILNGKSKKSQPRSNYNVHCVSQCQECNSIKTNSAELLDINSLKNMSELQREFLQLHEKHGHPSFASMKQQAKAGLLPKKFTAIKPEDFPVCISCKLGKATKLRRSKGTIIGDFVKVPGDLVHTDQVICSQPGRPMTISGRNNPTKVTCFTIYVDSIARKVFTEFQTSNDAKHTLAGKHRIEKEAASFDVTIKSYRADNGIFRAKEFIIDIEKHNQSISFCGVNEHNQNGIAERFIRTIVERARTSLLHASTGRK